MNPDRFHRLEELFAEAVELDGEEQARFLDQACGDDHQLRAELEELLRSDDASNEYLDRLNNELVSPAMQALFSENDPYMGLRLGPYVLEERIGRGGMGNVYRAKRDDGTFEQRVAVKIVRKDLSPNMMARFLSERRILGRLSHPGIAAIFDGGVAEDGLPWLAMEYVDGLPVTAYADRNRLSIRERLELFMRICDAISYAHRNLVIHRDLKPSNILITTSGEVKLLDFGIARLLDDGDTLLTQTGDRLLTPEYAAPEQITGDTLTIATDVYALGVLLYELLVGRRPYRLTSRIRHEIERAIIEDEPRRPSAVVTESVTQAGTTVTAQTLSELRRENMSSLQHLLTGDLDVIVLKTLRKEPELRYETAQALSEDVRNHLGGLPVTARPSTLRYRVNRFVRRNRWQVGAVSLILILLVGGLFGALSQASRANAEARRANEAAERAQEEYKHADAVTQFMIDLFHTASPDHLSGGVVTADEMLEIGLQQAETDFVDNPRMLGHVLNIIGSIYLGKGDYVRSEEILQRGLNLRQEMFDEESSELHESYLNLGIVYYYTRDYASADSLLTRALAIGERALPPLDKHLINTYNALGAVRQGMRDFATADSLLTIAAERVLESEGRESPTYSSIINNIGLVRRSNGDLAGAREAYTEALELQSQLAEGQIVNRGIILMNLAQIYHDMGDSREAEPLNMEAIEILTEVWGPLHRATLNAVGIQAHILIALDRHGPAEELLLRTYEAVRQTPNIDEREIVHMKRLLVNLYEDWGQPERAEQYR